MHVQKWVLVGRTRLVVHAIFILHLILQTKQDDNLMFILYPVC